MSDPKTLRDLLPDTNAGTINYVLANNGDGGFYWAAPGKTFGAPVVGQPKLPTIEEGGTGKTNRQEAINALLPSQQKQNGKILVTDGLNVSWDFVGAGTVTSVNVTGGTTGLVFSGGPITTSGTFGLGGVLAIANGGTGATTPRSRAPANCDAMWSKSDTLPSSMRFMPGRATSRTRLASSTRRARKA